MLAAEVTLPWREEYTRRSLRSSAAFPISLRGTTVSVITVYSDESGFFRDREVSLLAEIAHEAEFALEALETTREHRKAEALLREGEERFRQIADNIAEVFWIADPATARMLYVSPAFRKIWGRQIEPLHESLEPWFDSVHPEDREAARARILTARRHGGHDETYRIVRPDGEIRWIRERGSPILNASGEPYRFVGTAEDVTTRKIYVERITEQASVIDAAHESISVRSLEGKITYWNKGAEKTFGWFADEVLGRNITEIFDYGSERIAKALETTLEKGTWDGEVSGITREGRKIELMVHWTPIRDDKGRPKSILAIDTDITEKKALETQLLRAQRMESIGTLAGGLAHDLNNLLAPILMGLELLKISRDPSKVSDVIRNMELSANRGAELVKQVLSFARGLEGAKVPIVLSYTVREVVAIATSTFPKSISIEYRVMPDLWKVSADPTQINQVLMNLCVNSRDALADGGKLEIKAENIEIDGQYSSTIGGASPGRYVLLTVSDNGCGMPADVLDRIFEPFFTTKEPGKGTGLGLSTVLGIVKGHGGFVRVESALGKGSIFRVYLPALDSAPEEHSEPDADDDMPRGSGETILVVDDEDAVATITKQTLITFGYNVITATDGAQAVSAYALHKDRISAVLTDIMMPVMDGNALIAALQHLNPALPIIATSGRAVPKDTKAMPGVRRFDVIPPIRAA
jgi:PAS domain S-box-containing protein